MDLLLDQEGDDLPELRLKEKNILHIAAMTRAQQSRLRESVEPRQEEAAAMRPTPKEKPRVEQPNPLEAEDSNQTVATSTSKEAYAPFEWQQEIGGEHRPDLEKLCRDAYPADKTFQKVLHKPEDHKLFQVVDQLIYYLGNSENRTLCIPRSEFRGRRLAELVIDQVHRIVGHMGPRVTENYARRHFWWPTLGTDVKLFCDSCATCQATKTVNRRPQGPLHSLPIPTKPWSSIGMDFVGPFPLVDTLDYIWVVLCRQIGRAHV